MGICCFKEFGLGDPHNLVRTTYASEMDYWYVSTWVTLVTSASTDKISSPFFNFNHYYQEQTD